MSEINVFRPKTFNEFIGNETIIKNLKIYIYSAIKRKKPLDHVLLYGHPGIGKTSLASIIANELKSNIFIISGSNIEKTSDLISVLSSINENDVLFIDEIHRLDRQFEELLYSVMEDFKLSINYKGDNANKIIEVEVCPFTLIGATTRLGDISSPLRDRFGIKFNLMLYNNEELKNIIDINAKKLKLNISNEGLLEIAKRSKKTPRIAINYLKRTYDFAIYQNLKNIDKDFIINVFKQLKIDKYGLDDTDYKIIKILYENYNKKPVSLKSISVLLDDNITNIENVYEPYLVYSGIIERTKNGRKLTAFGEKIYRYIQTQKE